MHFDKLFTGFTKNYATNYFVIEFQKRGTGFSIDFHYQNTRMIIFIDICVFLIGQMFVYKHTDPIEFVKK